MLTRRTALSAGLAFASVAGATGFGAHAETAQQRPDAQAIDALLVEEDAKIPRQVAALIKARTRALAVIGIRLDAAAQAGLKRIFGQSSAIAGVSSGATLFCLERIGWDHGFRLTGRRQWCANDICDDAFRRDMAAFLSEAHPIAANPSPLVRAYRPSRADETLHAWVMQKSASPPLRQPRREA